VTGYLRPATVDEALAARIAHPAWPYLCGGTDLMVNAGQKAGPPGVIDLWAMPELCGITELGGGAVRIGAATPWLEMIESDLVAARAPILVAAAREIGALQIQARGTLGGNIGTSSPVGDSLPVLLALDAQLELRSVRGGRAVPYAGYCTGYRKTVLAPDELITAITIPSSPTGSKQLWRKVGTRRAQSISKVMAAAVLCVEGGRIRQARIGLGAVADRPIRAVNVEAAILDRAPNAATADAAAAALAVELKPITDVRSTAAYRMDTIQHVIRRFVLSIT